MNHQRVTARFAVVLAAAATLTTCGDHTPIEPTADELRVGTWGGERAGLIVADTTAHVHINCTFGDFPAPIELDDDGRFSVTGDYLIRAYPVAIGPTMPAVFAGVLRGRALTVTIAVNDTIEKKLVVLGPVTVTFGREPEMGPCPICRVPGDRPGVARATPLARDVYFAPAITHH